MERYFSDKANIFRYQKESDSLFVGKNMFERIQAAHPPIMSKVPFDIPDGWKLKVLGEHNRENAALAVAALRALGLPDEEIKNGIESFAGIEGRLQFVRDVNGTKIYNDNNATTPEATIVALKALGKDVTLIVGGSEKDLSLDGLVSEIKHNVSRVILLSHEKYKGSVRLANELRTANISFVEVATLQQAMDVALQIKEGTILFSPAFASFGMFKNEYERNDRFLDIIRNL